MSDEVKDSVQVSPVVEQAPVAEVKPTPTPAPAAVAQEPAKQSPRVEEKKQAPKPVPAPVVELPLSTQAKLGFDILNEYVVKMQRGMPVEESVVIAQQLNLRRALTFILTLPSNEFNSAYGKLLSFINEHRNGAFSDVCVFRSMDNIPLGQAEIVSFQSLLTMVTVTANPKSREATVRQLDFNKALRGLSDATRSNLMRFYRVN